MSITADRTVTETTEVATDTSKPVIGHDLMWLKPGETLAIKTRNSTYWVTRTIHAEAHGGHNEYMEYVTGFAVQSDSDTIDSFPHSPIEQMCSRYIRVGQSVTFFGDGWTSRVEDFNLL